MKCLQKTCRLSESECLDASEAFMVEVLRISHKEPRVLLVLWRLSFHSTAVLEELMAYGGGVKGKSLLIADITSTN